MRAPPKYGPQTVPKCGWICPVTRIRRELGMDFFWTARGPVVSGGKLREPIKGLEINGLPYCRWDDFQKIRWALQQSHQDGRKAAKIYCGIHGDEVGNRDKEEVEATAYTTQSDWDENAWNEGGEHLEWKLVENKKKGKKKRSAKIKKSNL